MQPKSHQREMGLGGNDVLDQTHHSRRTPTEPAGELWTTRAREQFEMLSEQTKELTALGQKMAGESAEPIARSVNQAFKKAS